MIVGERNGGGGVVTVLTCFVWKGVLLAGPQGCGRINRSFVSLALASPSALDISTYSHWVGVGGLKLLVQMSSGVDKGRKTGGYQLISQRFHFPHNQGERKTIPELSPTNTTTPSGTKWGKRI